MEIDRDRGSWRQCRVFTEGFSTEVVDRLAKLVALHAEVNARISYYPKGEAFPDEAKLGETLGLLPSNEDRKNVTDWWLAVTRGANTPNWDIASTCTVGSRPGLILVEAKAHTGELGSGGGGAKNVQNEARIRDAIAEASQNLNRISPGWNLTVGSHYQLCNRFAWAWRVASLGVPVILVYLGFLNVTDMPGYKVFRTTEEWTEAMHNHAEGIVPRDAWGKELNVNETPLIPLIKSWPAA
jgi:hypothetical protein